MKITLEINIVILKPQFQCILTEPRQGLTHMVSFDQQVGIKKNLEFFKSSVNWGELGQ